MSDTQRTFVDDVKDHLKHPGFEWNTSFAMKALSEHPFNLPALVETFSYRPRMAILAHEVDHTVDNAFLMTVFGRWAARPSTVDKFEIAAHELKNHLLRSIAGSTYQRVCSEVVPGCENNNYALLSFVGRFATPTFFEFMFDRIGLPAHQSISRSNEPFYNRAVLLPVILGLAGPGFGWKRADKLDTITRRWVSNWSDETQIELPVQNKRALLLYLQAAFHPETGVLQAYKDGGAFMSSHWLGDRPRIGCPAVGFSEMIFRGLHETFNSADFISQL